VYYASGQASIEVDERGDQPQALGTIKLWIPRR
jgi:hypothetical protein